MIDSSPGHVTDVENAVNAAKIDERPIAGNVLDCAFENHALLENLEDLFLQRVTFHFQKRPSRNDDVAPRSVKLEDRKTVGGADKTVQVSVRANIDMRAGEKRRDADIDLEAAFDLTGDMPFDAAPLVIGFFQVFPKFQIFCPLPGQYDAAAFAFRGVEEHIHVVSDLDLYMAFSISELLDRNLPFRLVADVDQHMGRRDADDPAFHHAARFDGAQALLKHRFKFTGAARGRALNLFVLFSHANQLRSI
jgi:hypothetical protein